MSPRELEAVLAAGLPGGAVTKRTLPDQVAFMAAELRALRAEIAAADG